MRRRDFLGLLGLTALPRLARGEESLLQYVSRPHNLGTPLQYFDQLITPTRAFFIRSHFGPPALDPKRKLRIDGLVKKPLELTAADLAKLPETTITSVLQCAGNGRALQSPRVPGVQWEHGAMGQATWTGVRLAEVLKLAGITITDRPMHVRLAGADTPPKPTTPAFVRSIPLARALHPMTLVATRMNGEPLTLAHGAPMRLIVPGWAGDHWIKWLTHVRVQKEEAEGFYYETAYRIDGKPIETFPVKSLIARPSDGGRARAGTQEIVGLAFSGVGAIQKVEVSVDDGKTWIEAQLDGDPGIGRAVRFTHRFDQKSPGRLSAMARATDDLGNIQPATPQWNPSGYFWNAYHRVSWDVL